MGKKKAAALHGISKKERKALKAREAAIAAELAAREAKAAKKAAKKGKKAKLDRALDPLPDDADKVSVKLTDTERQVVEDAKAEREAARASSPSAGFKAAGEAAAGAFAEGMKKGKTPKATVADAAEKAKATPSSEGARVAAETAAQAAAEAGDEETDEQIKARILAKRAERAAATAPIGGAASSVEALDAIIDPVKAVRAKVEKAKATAAAIVEVETERGREFVADAGLTPGSVAEELADMHTKVDGMLDEVFAKPSEAPRDDFEVNGNGQYKIKRLSDGKIVGYTRATTYISNLEDRSNLEKWKLRMLLEGVAINDHPDDNGRIDDPTVARMRDLIHNRDLAIAKARKADRKGKLGVGELATYVEGAWSDFKKAVNALAEELLEVGGVHEKAQKGTDIHALTELYDREGIDAVGQLLTDGKITPADLADVEAYADAIKRAGIRIIPELIEQTIVVEELKVAGRLDRVVMAKLPGMQRATRMVLDIKTGRVDLGAGKIAQQLELYSRGEGYDLNTHERTDLKLSRTKALLLHLPAGTAQATVHVVDLTLGRKGNALSGQVREWRNEGKRAIDLKTDLAAVTS
jgi:hypothetical protein